jgi:hypothetical protein
MKINIGRLITVAWYCQHLLVRGVYGRGEEEEGEKIRPTSDWLDEFYSNPENAIVEGHLTPRASDLPQYVYVPSNSTDLPITRPPEEDADELPAVRPPQPGGRKLGQVRDRLQDGRAIGLNILFNAQGIPFQGVNPPDPTGDVGKDHYVQMANSGSGTVVRVLNKITGAVILTFTLDGLGMGGQCANGNGDPIVLYDQFASRWFLSEFASGGNTLCVYVSTSEDATGAYVRYEFPTPSFPDYPKYGVWPDAYYVGTNEDTPAVYAMQRSQMVLGLPAVIVRNVGPAPLNGFVFDMIPPVDADGSTLPPVGPGLFVRHVDDEVHPPYVPNPASDLFEIYTLDINFGTLTSTLTLLQTIFVTDFDSNLCGLVSFACVPQPGSSTTLDPLREVVMNLPKYRNYGTFESMLVTWVTDVGTNRHAVRWMELRKAGSGAWGIHQQNTFAPDATNRWMSSPAMNKCNDIAIGYSVSGLTPVNVNPGLRITGRLSTDPLNQLDAEVNIATGGGPSSSNRWGDYSHMSVDPIDDFTFW